jgi:hypothetical protein
LYYVLFHTTINLIELISKMSTLSTQEQSEQEHMCLDLLNLLASPFENRYHSMCTILCLSEARPIFTTHILGTDRLHIMAAWLNSIITMIKLFPSSEELLMSLPDSVTNKYCDLYRIFVRFVDVLKNILNVEPIDNELRTIIVAFIINFENEVLSICSIIKTRKILRHVGPKNKSEPKPETEKKENKSKNKSKKDTSSVSSPTPRRSARIRK